MWVDARSPLLFKKIFIVIFMVSVFMFKFWLGLNFGAIIPDLYLHAHLLLSICVAFQTTSASRVGTNLINQVNFQSLSVVWP